MNMDLYGRIIDDVKTWRGPRLKVLKLSLYGEPFLNANFPKMLRIAKDAEIAERIETTTNASLLTSTISEKLIENGLDYLRVSIYSPLQEKHRHITKARVSVAQIHENLLTLKKIKARHKSAHPFVGVKMLDTFSEENELFSNSFRDVADEIYFDKPHSWIPYKDRNFMSDLYGKDADKARTHVASSNSKRIACTLPFFTLAIRSNGDVSPCCIDWIGGTNIGNISQENLEDIWDGDKMYEFRKMQLENRRKENASCNKCEFVLSDYYTRDTIDGFPAEKLRPRKK
jgi:radical SAM protein with 4Fe4S-binding SPASM domain